MQQNRTTEMLSYSGIEPVSLWKARPIFWSAIPLEFGLTIDPTCRVKADNWRSVSAVAC